MNREDRLQCHRETELWLQDVRLLSVLDVFTSVMFSVVVVSKHCSLLVDSVIVKCQPLCLLMKFTAILLVASYITRSSNKNNRDEVRGSDLHYQWAADRSPSGISHSCWGSQTCWTKVSVLPNLHQHVDFPTNRKRKKQTKLGQDCVETTSWAMFIRSW